MRILFLLCALIPVLSVFGQEPNGELTPENREEIESMKVAYITRKVNFTTEESQKFWPVYNEYFAAKQAHRQMGGKFKKQFSDREGKLSEGELDRLMADYFAHEREAIALEERYYNQFKEVITPEKLAAFYEADREFKRFLLGKLRERRQGEPERRRK